MQYTCPKMTPQPLAVEINTKRTTVGDSPPAEAEHSNSRLRGYVHVRNHVEYRTCSVMLLLGCINILANIRLDDRYATEVAKMSEEQVEQNINRRVHVGLHIATRGRALPRFMSTHRFNELHLMSYLQPCGCSLRSSPQACYNL